MRALAAGLGLAALALPALPAAPAAAAEVRIGTAAVRVEARDAPFGLRFTDRAGRTVLVARALTLDGAPAQRLTDLRREGGRALATARFADGRTAALVLTPQDSGQSVALELSGRGARRTGIAFAARPGERFVGFGERSDAVAGNGREVENQVADGPFPEDDRAIAGAITPPWAERDRDDATYFPLPWALSSRGTGVLLRNDETSRFRFRRDRWTAEADAAKLALEVFPGPAPAQALRRMTKEVGRQPKPSSPWSFGPWVQTGQPNVVPLEDERRIVQTLRRADAPVSAAETQMHYLPCGAHRGNAAYERARTAQFHGAGLAHLAYLNPQLCRSYEPVFSRAAAAGVLQRGPDGAPFTHPSFVGGGGAAGFTQEPLAQFDFTAPGAGRLYDELLRELFTAGKDGWMEDFGEYTPPEARSADGTPATRMHNRYPTTYHCAVRTLAERLPRPVSRHLRSGWTGTAACADVVWGGDPSTVWGFDGLRSVVTQALTMGLSGVSRWGTDIGGYNSFGEDARLTPELLRRWIQVGAALPVMRTKRSGIAIPSYERPQVFDPAILPVWRRYAKLHTQLHPYLLAADRTYRDTGLPAVRHGLLTHPRDPRAARADDQYLLGPHLLVAPVLRPGARRRTLYAPRGTWVDFWRSVAFRRSDGAFVPRAPRLLAGGRSHALPAPEDELPLLVRAGALLPLLAADVDTLAPYDGPGVTTAAEREDRRTLLAFPRGRTVARAGEDGRIVSTEGRRRWTLTIAGPRTRSYTLRASLRTLRRPFRPRRVLAGDRALRRSAWTYDARTGVLTVTARLRHGTLRVQA